MSRSPFARARGVIAVGLLAGLVVACSSGKPAAAPSSSAPSTSTTTSAVPSPPRPTPKPKPKPKPKPTKAPPKPVPSSPLSGRTGGAIAGRVVVVKIDNSPDARPQTGLALADVVYLEPVEAGITRIAAVFSSHVPDIVGPVRSGRASDPELFAQYGRVVFAFSGAQAGVRRIIQRSPMYTFDNDSGGGGFRRSGSRRAPYNLYVSPAQLLAQAPNAVKAHDIGFRFGPRPGGSPATRVTARWQRATATFTWSAAAKRWRWTMDGRAQQGLGGTTVLVQYVTVVPSRFVDVNGAHSPTIRTVGRGTGLVLRDGHAWAAAWSRPSAAAGTHWTVGGRPMTFAAGQVWVVLLDRHTPASVS